MSTGRVPSRPQPRIDPSAYLAPGVWVLGDVRVGPQASVWFGSVLRGDLHFIEVGRVRRSLSAGESPAEALASDYVRYAREHWEGKYPLYQAPKRKGCQR